MLQELAIDQLILRIVVIHVPNSIFLSIFLIMESDQILSKACSLWSEYVIQQFYIWIMQSFTSSLKQMNIVLDFLWGLV